MIRLRKEQSLWLTLVKFILFTCCLGVLVSSGHVVVFADNGRIGELLVENDYCSALNNDETFSLGDALLSAKPGDMVTARDKVIDKDVVIGDGVTLKLIPSADGTVIKSGVTVTVFGTLIVGESQSKDDSGDLNDEKIVVDGSVAVYGTLKVGCSVVGGGTIQSYGKVYEPIDYVFKEANNRLGRIHSLRTVRVRKIFYAGSEYYGCTSDENFSVLKVIGADGLIRLKSGKVEFDYESKSLNQIVCGKDLSKIGKTTVKIFGEVGVSSENVVDSEGELTLPYNYRVVLEASSAVTIEKGTTVKVLPGATLTVSDKASLVSDGSLFVYDTLFYATGTGYPSMQSLYECGYDKTGRLSVDGTFIVNGAFGGLVETNGLSGIVKVSDSALTAVKLTDKYYIDDKLNEAEFTAVAMVKGLYGYTALCAGKTYKSYAISPFTQDYIVIDRWFDGEVERKNYVVYLYKNAVGIFGEVAGDKFCFSVPVSIGEKVKYQKVTVQGNDYYTDENGAFTAKIYLDGSESSSVEYSSSGSAKTYSVKPSQDKTVVLNRVVKTARLSADNDYVISKDGLMKNFYADVLFYGGGVEKTLVFADVTESDRYAETATFSSEEFPVTNSLTAELYFYKQALDDYLNAFNGLIAEDLTFDAVNAVYKTYLDITFGRTKSELDFISRVLNDACDYNYLTDVFNYDITYGEKSVKVKCVGIDGREVEKEAELYDYLYENGDISVTASVVDYFYGKKYFLVKKLGGVKKREISYSINSVSSEFGDDVLKLNGEVKSGTLDCPEEDVVLLETSATKKSPVGFYRITGKCVNPFYAVRFFNGTYTVVPKPVTLKVKDAVVEFDSQKSVFIDIDTDHISAIKGFNVYNGNKKVAIIDLYANLSDVLGLGEYTITPIIDDNYTLNSSVSAKLTVIKGDKKYAVSFGFSDGYVKVYDGSIFSLSVVAVKKSDGTPYEGDVITSVTRDGLNVIDITDVGRYVVSARIEDEVFSTVLTVIPKPVDVIVEDFCYYGDAPENIEFKTSCPVPDGSVKIIVYGETLTAEILDKNYIVQSVSGKVKKIKRPLTVRILPAEKFYGQTDCNLTAVTVSGCLSEGQTLSNIIRIIREPGEAVGEYKIKAETLNDDYDVSVIGASFTVLPRPVTITCHDEVFTYGEKIVLHATLTKGRFAFDDDIYDVIKFPEPFKSVGRSEYSVTSINENYSVTVKPATLTVRPKKITVVLKDGKKYYGTADEFLAYSDDVDVDVLKSVVKIRRTSDETVGAYSTTIESLSKNYSVSAVYTHGSHSVLTIEKARVTVNLSDLIVDFSYDFEKITANVKYSTLGGKTYDDLNLKFIIKKNGVTADAGVFGTARAIGEYVLSAFTDNENYDISVNEALLDITKRALTLDNLSEKFTYTGEEIRAFDKSLNLVGLLDPDVNIDVEYYLITQNGNLLRDEIIVAGSYLVSVVVPENSGYFLAVSDYVVTVDKKDASENIVISLSHGDFAVVGDNSPIASLIGYNATVLSTTYYFNEEVFKIENVGKYIVKAYVEDENLTGQATFVFKGYESVADDISEISELLSKARLDRSLRFKNLLKIKEKILSFTRYDVKQIEQKSVYKSVIDEYSNYYKEFFKQENSKYTAVKNDFDHRFVVSSFAFTATLYLALFVRRFLK